MLWLFSLGLTHIYFDSGFIVDTRIYFSTSCEACWVDVSLTSLRKPETFLWLITSLWQKTMHPASFPQLIHVREDWQDTLECQNSVNRKKVLQQIKVYSGFETTKLKMKEWKSIPIPICYVCKNTHTLHFTWWRCIAKCCSCTKHSVKSINLATPEPTAP